MFRGDGNCANVDWKFLDLSMPGWTLVFFLTFVIVGLVLTLHDSISAGALEPYFGQLIEFKGEFEDAWSAVGDERDRGGEFKVSLELVVGSWRGGPVSSMRGREVVPRRAPKP